MNTFDRFMEKVNKQDFCWVWMAGKTKAGYGIFHPNNKEIKYAHRFMYEMNNGEIPKGKVIRHSCDNPPCVNPDHLLIGTHADNALDKIKRRRHPAYKMTHCKWGHEFSKENIVSNRDPNNTTRACKPCQRKVAKESYRLKKEKMGFSVSPINSLKTHCPSGHKYTKENIVHSLWLKRGYRKCKICKNRINKEYKQRIKAG